MKKNAFISLMKEHNIEVKSIILFGSFAKNKEHMDSDIDLAVVSDKFEEDDFKKIIDQSFQKDRTDTIAGIIS